MTITILLWAYFLGPWAIGPFTSRWECERARSYQVQHNPASAHEVSVCKAVDEVMQEVGL